MAMSLGGSLFTFYSFTLATVPPICSISDILCLNIDFWDSTRQIIWAYRGLAAMRVLNPQSYDPKSCLEFPIHRKTPLSYYPRFSFHCTNHLKPKDIIVNSLLFFFYFTMEEAGRLKHQMIGWWTNLTLLSLIVWCNRWGISAICLADLITIENTDQFLASCGFALLDCDSSTGRSGHFQFTGLKRVVHETIGKYRVLDHKKEASVFGLLRLRKPESSFLLLCPRQPVMARPLLSIMNLEYEWEMGFLELLDSPLRQNWETLNPEKVLRRGGYSGRCEKWSPAKGLSNSIMSHHGVMIF